MSIFVVLTLEENPQLETIIKEKFPEDSLKIAPNQWLVCSGGTTQSLAEILLITDKEKGPGAAIVFSITNYWGRAATNIWEWLQANWEKDCD